MSEIDFTNHPDSRISHLALQVAKLQAKLADLEARLQLLSETQTSTNQLLVEYQRKEQRNNPS